MSLQHTAGQAAAETAESRPDTPWTKTDHAAAVNRRRWHLVKRALRWVAIGAAGAWLVAPFVAYFTL